MSLLSIFNWLGTIYLQWNLIINHSNFQLPASYITKLPVINQLLATLICIWITRFYFGFEAAKRVKKLILKSDDLHNGNGFEIRFKCMSGFTTENGKFIMPLQEKNSYGNSVDQCESFGFSNHIHYVIWWKLLLFLNRPKTNSNLSIQKWKFFTNSNLTLTDNLKKISINFVK